MLPATRSSLSLSRPHAAGDAARIRMLAGTPYSRRGSVLVLVVGVLALLAIIIVVYTSVGQADVRGGRAMVNKSRLDDQSHAMADYIARLVGEDASATKVQPVSMASGGPAFLSVHEGMDYPYTDPFARSILTIAYSVPAADKDFARFSPVGTITTPYTANGGLDPRVPSDPWLASTEPTWINNGFATLPPVPAPGQLLGHQRDWQHMSIIAPSGLPVNLAMLRGNFTAASGFTPRPYQADATRISDWMYVWRASAANSNYLAASDARQVTGLPAAYNTPATWSNDCTDTFRPVTWNPANKLVLGDVKWMGNRLADADGDGFYDSVWQELVDVSDINNPVNLLPGGTGGGVRWFIAPRIIDLSGLVNVNTATSFAVPPDAENPAGLTPSDIDLERLLTTADIRQYFDLNPVNDLIGGNQFQAGGNIDALTVAGKWAFNGLFESRATGMTEASDNQVSSADPAGTELNVPSWLREIGVDRGGRRVAIGSVTRKTLYYTGGNDDTRQLRNPVGTNGNYYVKQGSGFGLADELELRKFNGLNDPTVRSRLEAVTQYAPTGQPNLYSASPLRPDRDLVAERDAAIVPGNNATIDGEQVPRAMAQHFFDVRHLLTTISGARPFGYSASLIANPLTPTATAARPLGESELRVDVNTLLESAVSVTTATNNVYPLGSANTIFQNYAMALSPFLGNLGFTGSPSGSESLWLDATGGANLRNLTLTFGGVSYKPLTNRADIGETDTPKFKGRAPEIAVRSAAHLALNLMAMRDDSRLNAASAFPDNRLLAATVLLDESFRASVHSNPINGVSRFPFWQAAGNTRLSPLDPTPVNAFGATAGDIKAYTFDLNGGQPGTVQRLANNNFDNNAQPDRPAAVNIYAAQPQPFITAAVSFDMYYDAPRGNGGDSRASGPTALEGEWWVSNPGNPGAGQPPTIQSLGITIKGDVINNNPDFLMEAVAFQVTNPFDAPLTLADSSGNSTYYFEFNGKYYDARGYDNGGARLGPVTIAPRQSMCFYVLSSRPAEITAKWNTADPTVNQGVVDSWLSRQLNVITGGQAALRTVEINPATMAVIASGPGVTPLLNGNSNADENKVVKLWRVIHDLPRGEAFGANRTANDYLVDRLHDPSFGVATDRAALYRRLKDGQNRFTLIPAGPEPGEPEYQAPDNVERENVGYGITMFGVVRRRTDPLGGPLPGQPANTTMGVMPAWCMEAKIGAAFEATVKAKNIVDANVGFVDPGATAVIQPTDISNQQWGGRLVRDMFQKGLQRPFTAAAKHPATRTGSGAGGTGSFGDNPADRIGDDWDGIDWIAGNKPVQLPVYPRRTTARDPKYPELPPLRPGDLLMPWAIGPYSYGQFNPGLADDERKHTTLSEAMAFGLNYSRARAGGNNEKWYEFQIGKVLDRCHLPTDRFTPFNDANTDGQWNYNQGNPDPPIANGIPFALNILDRFRTMRYGTLDSVTPGVVNINTAPLSVLRMLPFLAPPSADLYSSSDSGGLKNHWMNATASGPFALQARNEAGQKVPRSLWDTQTVAGAAYANRWDVAATLAAYRDMQAVVARGAQGSENGSALNNGRVYIDFSRGARTPGLPPLTGNDNTLAYGGPVTSRAGRPFMTNVPEARQEPGFASPGEVLMAVVQDNTRRINQNLTDDQNKQLGITRLETPLVVQGTTVSQTLLTDFISPVKPIINTGAIGRPGPEVAREQAIGLTAAVPARQPVSGGAGMPEPFVQAGRSNDYDRRIAIANALMNCISTTSDIYCAYFVVRGYTEGDVQGLEPYTGNTTPSEERYTLPMTPSIERRYMMVIDRSNCARSGDKPRILMFEELPLH